ncbi:DUF7289 family protein [Natrinema sp. CGMCC1.2065]|uniref:DUF7289 family protein n=1 Tax=Natrinema sp. CGMCC1.2065 TaxID=3445767 RepID=UPI003F4A56EE
MGFRRADGPAAPSQRGQSAILALVLLIGMVATISIGILLVAGDVMTSTEQQAESERVEQAFVELSKQMATVSKDSDAPRAMTFDAGERGAITRTSTGNITIKARNVNETLRMGSIEYEADDGSILAYQAGGVWRETGNETRIVSQPPITYSAEEQTLSLPVTTVSGEHELSSGEVDIRHNDTDPVRNATVVENDTVTLEITSKYYRGWELYFEEEVGDASVRNVTQLEGDKGYVKVELGLRELEGAFDDGATVSGEVSEKNEKHGYFDGSDTKEGKSMPPLDGTIYKLVEDTNTTENDEGTIDGGTFTNGTYFADEVNLDDDVTFDLSKGNATLVVDGDVNIGGNSFKVTNATEDDHVLQIYMTGDLTVGGEMCVDECVAGDEEKIDAKHLQLYGTSESVVMIGTSKNDYFEGLLYVAGDEEYFEGGNYHSPNGCEDKQICIQNGNVDGSIVAASIGTQSATPKDDFTYDGDLQGYEPDLYPAGYVKPQDITYLNVAVHTLDVKNK